MYMFIHFFKLCVAQYSCYKVVRKVVKKFIGSSRDAQNVCTVAKEGTVLEVEVEVGLLNKFTLQLSG